MSRIRPPSGLTPVPLGPPSAWDFLSDGWQGPSPYVFEDQEGWYSVDDLVSLGLLGPSYPGTLVPSVPEVTPREYTPEEIRTFIEATYGPDITPEEANQIGELARNNGVSAEQISAAMGVPLETVQPFYSGQPNTGGVPAPTPDPGQSSSPISGAVDAVKDVVGKTLEWFQTTPGAVGYDPTTGTISGVWGPHTLPTVPIYPPIQVPGTQTSAGVVVSDPILGAIISGVSDILGGGVSPETIPDIVSAVIQQQTGLPGSIVDAAVAGVPELKEAVQGVVNQQQAAPTPEYTPEDIRVFIENTYNQDGEITPDEGYQIGQQAADAGLTPEDISGATGVPIGTVETYFPGYTPPTDTPVTGGPTDTPPDDTPPDETPADQVPEVPWGLMGMLGDTETVNVKPGGVVDIKYLYDIGGESILPPPLAAEDKLKRASGPRKFARGGEVGSTAVDDIVRILRG